MQDVTQPAAIKMAVSRTTTRFLTGFGWDLSICATFSSLRFKELGEPLPRENHGEEECEHDRVRNNRVNCIAAFSFSHTLLALFMSGM
jgi:hypothetical protein